MILNEPQRHGHVFPRKDGGRAKCGGLRACEHCQDEYRKIEKFLEQGNEINEPTETVILCHQKNCKQTGCRFCSGYGFIYEQVTMTCCGVKYWSRPGAYTYTEGKRFHSVDGLEVVCHMNRDWECGECADK